jgi:NADP-dependent 3-hydroxy acid dehydrogenase YdfG
VASRNIRVTQIHPGGTASEMVTENTEQKAEMVEGGALLHPDDVAEAVLFAVTRRQNVDVTELTLRPHNQSRL